MKKGLADRMADLERALDNLSDRLHWDGKLSEDILLERVSRSLDLDPGQITKTQLANLRGGFFDVWHLDMENILSEATIQCFEICYEMFEKSLRQFLQEAHKVSREEMRSSVEIFRSAYRVGAIDEQHESLFVLMRGTRNQTVHTYTPERTREIIKDIRDYHTAMSEVYNRMAAQIGATDEF